MAALMRAVTTFHGPEHLFVREGELRDGDDPVVKSFRTFFRPASESTVRRIETGVQRPGTER